MIEKIRLTTKIHSLANIEEAEEEKIASVARELIVDRRNLNGG